MTDQQAQAQIPDGKDGKDAKDADTKDGTRKRPRQEGADAETQPRPAKMARVENQVNRGLMENLLAGRHVGTDVEFKVGADQTVIKAHRHIIQTQIKGLAKFLAEGMVEFKDCDPKTFTVMVDFAYGQAIPLDGEDRGLVELVHYARRFDFPVLAKACIGYLHEMGFTRFFSAIRDARIADPAMKRDLRLMICYGYSMKTVETKEILACSRNLELIPVGMGRCVALGRLAEIFQTYKVGGPFDYHETVGAPKLTGKVTGICCSDKNPAGAYGQPAGLGLGPRQKWHVLTFNGADGVGRWTYAGIADCPYCSHVSEPSSGCQYLPPA